MTRYKYPKNKTASPQLENLSKKQSLESESFVILYVGYYRIIMNILKARKLCKKHVLRGLIPRQLKIPTAVGAFKTMQFSRLLPLRLAIGTEPRLFMGTACFK